MKMNNKELFLKELTELSKKYDIYIGGCGCCGSPYLDDEEPEYPSDGELQWDKEDKRYITE